MALLRGRRSSPAQASTPTSTPQGDRSTGIDLLPISAATPRRRIAVEGQVTRMHARPTTGQPSLAVTISDDSGSVTAVWTGRRSIGGITLGRRLIIEGVASRVGDRLEFSNPAYTLLP